MKLEKEFIKLPFQFDSGVLEQEVLSLKEQDWHPHHESFIGNFSVPLLSVNGELNNLFSGPIKETAILQQLAYTHQVISSFGEIVGRSRFMKLTPGAEVPLHSDINFHWYNRVRIHVPIITTEQVIFSCGDKSVHMKPGECWIFDSWKNHKVVNASDNIRVHLVVDIMGSSRFWAMVRECLNQEQEANFIKYEPNVRHKLLTEKVNSPIVMSPGELSLMVGELIDEVTQNNEQNKDAIKKLQLNLTSFLQEWRQLYTLYGEHRNGWDFYHKLRDMTYRSCKPYSDLFKLSNGGSATQMLIHCLIDPCFNPEVSQYR